MSFRLFVAHSLFAAGIPASYNAMAPLSGYGLLGQGGPSPFAPPSLSNNQVKDVQEKKMSDD